MNLLGGLPVDVTLDDSQVILKYLLLLLYVYCIPGVIVFSAVRDQTYFWQVRSGFCSWCRRIYRKAVISSVILTGMLTVFYYVFDPSFNTVVCGGVLLLNVIVMNMLQSFIMLYTRKGSAGFTGIMTVSLLSLFCSAPLPGNWKIILFGNCGCFNRCSMIAEDGYEISTAIVAEAVMVFILYAWSYKLVKRKMNS